MKKLLKPPVIAPALSSVSALACEKPQVTGYTSVDCLKDGLAGVKQNGKWGFIDNTGKVVIPVQYDNAWVFENGKALVQLNGEEFYIDETGKRLN